LLLADAHTSGGLLVAGELAGATGDRGVRAARGIRVGGALIRLVASGCCRDICVED
jgi:hypothetical protein